jgi:ribonuclease HIII
MDSTAKTRLGVLLCQAQLLMPSSSQPGPSAELQDVFNSICRLVFDERIYRELWDEPILSLLSWLFQVKPPALAVFGDEVAELGQRIQHVRRMNDFFFQILNREATIEMVCEGLATLSPAEPALRDHLRSSDRLQAIRETEAPPSERISAFLDTVSEDLGLDLASQESVKGCLDALKAREGAGVVNALLVKTRDEGELVIALHIKVQPGNGRIHTAISGRDDFEATLGRARLALLARGFLRESDDIICTLDLTEPQYLGTSIGLAAAVGMYGAARGIAIDPYTAFTGDINLDRGYWRVRGVAGLAQKLEAARRCGGRRVFIPRENVNDAGADDLETLQVIPVDDLLQVFLQLQAPLQPLAGDSLQVRKINALQAFCQAQGWDLAPLRPIQDGVQLRILPFHLPELVLNVYNTGTHIPKRHEHPEYQALLKALQATEEPRIPIRKVEERFNVRDPSLRAEIREALEPLQPAEGHEEPYCEYMLRFERGQERLVVKQYQRGTLHLQGTAGELYKAILECIIPHYNLRHPNAQLSVPALLQLKEAAIALPSIPAISSEEIPYPHIGTDESGKGDYFGPMVVAGVLVDALTTSRLEALGVKDSKLLPDKQCRELAAHIREICRGKYEEVEMLPERYNELYERFRTEGKNLNHLLAWGHARAIESLLARFPCTHAVADQFGDEHYIHSKLMEQGKRLQLIQVPKGERYLAVAAASILARDRFLARLEKLSQEYGMVLPKGASESVVETAKAILDAKGISALRKVAKLHHKTTTKLTAQGDRIERK